MATHQNPAEELEQILLEEAQLLSTGNPPDPALALRRGRLLLALTRYQEALTALEEATAIRQARSLDVDPAINKTRASVLFRMNRYSESLAEIVNSARLRNAQGLPEDWELSKTRGNCLLRMGQYEEALTSYARAEQIQLEQGQEVYPFLSMNRGAVFQELGRLEEALAEFDKTERLLEEQGQPPDHDLTMNRGVVLKVLRRHDESLAAYRLAEELLQRAGLPEDVNLNMNLGELYSEIGRTQEAAQRFERAEELCRERGIQPSDVLIFNQAMNHHRAGQQDRAIAEALRTIEAVSRQNVAVKPFYVETLRDWLTPTTPGSTPVGNTRGAKSEPIPDSEKRHDVFLSYRRDPGHPYSMLVKLHLEMQGKEVFRDQDDLPAGRFEDALVEAIRYSRHMVVLMTPGFFERCSADPDDVVSREIATALDCGTHIIPVMLEGFVWPKPAELPGQIREIASLNAMSFSTEFLTAFIDKLLKWMGD